MALTNEEKQRVREEEIERLRVRRELSGDPLQQDWNRLAASKAIIFWVVLLATAVLLWYVVKSSHSH